MNKKLYKKEEKTVFAAISIFFNEMMYLTRSTFPDSHARCSAVS